jgi:hypothetical protein
MPAMAYRPYWRAFDSKRGNWWNTEDKGSLQNYYFYPGQEISIELRIVGPQRMMLSIEGAWNGEEYQFEKEFEQLEWFPGSPIIW